MSQVCRTCGHILPALEGVPALPVRELEALSAWWHLGTTKSAADLLSRSERTVINQLYSARRRNGLHTTGDLVPLYLGGLRTMAQLVTSHNVNRRKAA